MSRGRPDAVWQGFLDAVVQIEVPGGTWRLESRPTGTSGEFPFAGRVVHIITPYNPDGIDAPQVENEARHRAMAAALPHDAVVFDTVGSAPDGSWPEPGFGLVGLSRDDAVDLGRRFGQRAIYEWTADSLTIVVVDESSAAPTGWALVAVTR